MKRITVIAMVGVLMSSGCSIFNWDMNHQESVRKGPGAQAKGAAAYVEYGADGKIVAKADKFIDQDGKEYPAEAEVRKDVNTSSKAWASDFDLLRFGSQKELNIDSSINQKGEVNITSDQEPHGFTMTEWLLIGAAVVFGPLLLGGIATAIGFPAIGSILTLVSPITWLSKLKALVPTTSSETPAETPAVQETEK